MVKNESDSEDHQHGNNNYKEKLSFSSSPLRDVWATPSKSATGNTKVISNTFRLARC